MKVEFLPWEWRTRRGALRNVTVKHECSNEAECIVFVCRDTLDGTGEDPAKAIPGYACGKHCCAAVGGGGDNRCASCWCALDAAREAGIVAPDLGGEA